MIKPIGIAAVTLVLCSTGAVACPGDKATKGTTAENMSTPSEKFVKEQQKSGKSIKADVVNTELKAPKPKV